jgi:small subunit ribosomal protein S35
MHYQGESHPAVIKRVIVVPVDQLPLSGEQAIHKIKLLAGPRWTPNPPIDAGVGLNEEWKNGFIKISCESFPRPSMNLKWASDTLDKLVEVANVGIFLYIFRVSIDDVFRTHKTRSVTCRLTCVMFMPRH